jgi:hypothetical protein
MSKREFIEAAVSDALARAEEAIERSGALNKGACNAHSDRHHPSSHHPGRWRQIRRPARSFPLTCAPDRGPRQPWSGSTLHPHSSDTKPFEGRVGEQVSVPVRAWAPGRP